MHHTHTRDRSSADTTVAILDLSVEVLERVVSFVDPQGVIASRSTCKQLEKAAVRSFIHHFIKHRHHVISNQSLEALVKITAHAYFGRFVNTIVLDTLFPFVRVGDVYMNATDESLTRRRFRLLVFTALSHLKVYGNPITLGVSDYNISTNALRSRPGAPPLEHRRYEIFFVLRHFAADESINLNIKGFDLDLVEERRSGERSDASKFATAVASHFSTLSNLTSLRIYIDRLPEGKMDDFLLVWDPELRSLEVEGIDEWQGPESMTSGLFKDMTWPSSAGIKHLILSDCRCDEDTDFIQLMDLIRSCIGTLETIKLQKIVIIDNSRWSLVLHQLAQAPHLKSFELTYLERDIFADINSVEQRATIKHIDSWCGSGDETLSELVKLTAIVKADEDKWESMDDEDSSKWEYFRRGRNKHFESVNRTNADAFGMMTWRKSLWMTD
jgi:hypothetical protein